jgi:HEAT repeat protein
MHSESLRDLLIRLTLSQEKRVSKAAARALAILGMLVLVLNLNLCDPFS